MAHVHFSWRDLAQHVKANGVAGAQIPPSPLSRLFFATIRMAWLWLAMRLYVGWQWLMAGWLKLTGYAIWGATPPHSASWIFTPHLGVQLRGFLLHSLAQGGLQPWYASFVRHVALPQVGLFTYLVTFGEVCVGLGLICGAFTGIAAIGGVFMSLNYVCAGSVSINPQLVVFGILLALAWRVAGHYGADRVLLPLVGTPWTGSLVWATSHATALRQGGATRRTPLAPGPRVRRLIIHPAPGHRN
jgi:thiosulfate dehydrogenase [quinone] large subunit